MKIKTILTSSSLLLTGLASFASPILANADSIKVKAGDTASQIAEQNNLSLDQLQHRNQGVDLNLINPGQHLNVSPNTYTVKAGDTLSQIAEKYKVDLTDLKQINHLSDNLITVGQKLTLNKQTSNTDQSTQTTQTNVVAQVQAPTYNAQPTTTYQAPTTNQNTTPVSHSDSWAKNWIANKESGGNYNASNGNFYGKYQLNKASLGGDYSPANQERAADRYVTSRYGSWDNAQKFWVQNGWY